MGYQKDEIYNEFYTCIFYIQHYNNVTLPYIIYNIPYIIYYNIILKIVIKGELSFIKYEIETNVETIHKEFKDNEYKEIKLTKSVEISLKNYQCQLKFEGVIKLGGSPM